MNNRESHAYVNGTAALEIPSVRSSAGVIRVDFRRISRSARAQRADSPSATVQAEPPARGGAAPLPVRNGTRRLILGRDVAVAVSALGLREMREELEYGSAAGSSVRAVSWAQIAACCAVLGAFSLLVGVL